MAWGLEARVPFLDKAFLEVALNIDPKEKMFNKGEAQEVDEDGQPKMEKVCKFSLVFICLLTRSSSIFYVKLSTVLLMER
jgi:hypothetical protein